MGMVLPVVLRERERVGAIGFFLVLMHLLILFIRLS